MNCVSNLTITEISDLVTLLTVITDVNWFELVVDDETEVAVFTVVIVDRNDETLGDCIIFSQNIPFLQAVHWQLKLLLFNGIHYLN